MAKIHVLGGGAGDVYQVVVHTNTPAGNNKAGVLWSDVIKNSGRNTSVMVNGTGPGQITTAELTAIQNGTVIEGVFSWEDNSSWTAVQRQDDLDVRANQLIDELTTSLQRQLKYFGFSRP
jgi:hypothetical protein